MAVPKKKVSKARRDKRRSNNWKLDLPGMVKCPKCGDMLLKKKGKNHIMVCRNAQCDYKAEVPEEAKEAPDTE